MKHIIPFLAFAMMAPIAGGLYGEELSFRVSSEPEPQLPAGPTIGKKISEFRSHTVTGRHLCWSCYG